MEHFKGNNTISKLQTMFLKSNRAPLVGKTVFKLTVTAAISREGISPTIMKMF